MFMPLSVSPVSMTPAQPSFGSRRQRQRDARKLQELQAENERLTARLEMAQNASGQIVHDLRNEAARIGSMFNLMNFCREGVLAVLQGRFGDKAERIFDSGPQAVENMTDMFAELTDLYSTQVRREEVSIAQLGSAWEKSLSPLTHQFPYVHISMDLTDGLEKVEVDPIKLNRVITNLVKNACEAMRDNDKQEGEVIVSLRPEADNLVIEVRDTGPGMNHDVCGRLFTLGVTTKHDGHGIGLVNCKELVELHGGSLNVDSNPGEGTVFRITLPKSGPQPAGA